MKKIVVITVLLAAVVDLNAYNYRFKNLTGTTIHLKLEKAVCQSQEAELDNNQEYTFGTGGCCLKSLTIEGNGINAFYQPGGNKGEDADAGIPSTGWLVGQGSLACRDFSAQIKKSKISGNVILQEM